MLGKCEKVEVVHFGVVVCLPGAHRYLNEMHISKWPPRLKGYYREIKAMMQQNNTPAKKPRACSHVSLSANFHLSYFEACKLWIDIFHFACPLPVPPKKTK